MAARTFSGCWMAKWCWYWTQMKQRCSTGEMVQALNLAAKADADLHGSH